MVHHPLLLVPIPSYIALAHHHPLRSLLYLEMFVPLLLNQWIILDGHRVPHVVFLKIKS